MANHTLCRFLVLVSIALALGHAARAAEDIPTPGAVTQGAQYKRADAKFYAHGDVLKADPAAVILPPTALAQNGEIYTYTPKKKAPKFIYAEVPNDWIEPITPPDMTPLNIAPDAMQVREPHGDVQVAMPSAPTSFSPAADGEPLPNGAVIKTGDNSTAAILFGGVDSARLMPNSEAAVQQAVASTSRAAEVDLTVGGVFSKVGTQAGVQSDYQVHTPYGTALAAGGDFVTLLTNNRIDLWVYAGTVELLQPDGKKFGTATGDGKGPLKLIRYPAAGMDAISADADSLSTILGFIPMANQKLAALHQKAAANVPLTANEQAYLARIKQVPALIKLEIIAMPPSTLTVLADGKASLDAAGAVTLAQLKGVLTGYASTAYQPYVSVKAGPGVTYADFQAALAACKATPGLKYEVVGETPTAPPPPLAAQDVVVVANGMVKLNGAALKLDDFTAKLKALIATAPDVTVTVHADPKAAFTDISAVIDACKAAPVKNLNIQLPKLTELTVSAHQDGTIGFHGATLKLDDFSPDLKAAVALFPDLPVVLHSNPAMNYTKFKAVADACNAAGAKQVTVVQPAPQPPPPPSLKAFVQADGSIKFQDASLKLDEFTTKFKDALAATPDAPVTIKADSKASYADISAAIDAIKATGPKNFNATLPATKELSVTVHGDSSILFHGTTVSADAFANEIKAAVALYPDAPIVIHSNPKADYTKFQAVVDAAHATSAKEVTVVQPAPEPPKPVVATQPPTPAMPPTAETPPTPAPAPAPEKPAAPPQPLTVIAHLDGSIKFQGKTMQIDEFTLKIKDAVAAHPDVAVIIHSNPKMDFAKFQSVVDACKNAPAKEVDVVPPAPQPAAAAPAAPVATGTTTPPAPLKPLTVYVHDDGSVGFQGKRGTLDEFKTKVAAMVTATPDRELIIKASGPKVAYEHIKAVLDACADAHVAHVSAPEPPPPAPAAPAVAAETPATNAEPAAPTPPVPAPVNDKPVPAQIDLAADGSLKLDGTAITEDDLKVKLADIKATNPKNPLVMMKQPGVTKEQWTHYVDLAHSMGLKLLVKNGKAPAIQPMAATPPSLRPSAAEGGPAIQPPPAAEQSPAPATETPSTNAAPAISSTEEAVPVEIELTPDGLIAFLGETVSDSELQKRLDNVARANVKEPVLIVKDEKVTHEQLQHVLDMCHAAKLKFKVKVVKSSDTGALKPHASLPLALQPPPAGGDAAAAKRILPVEIGLATKGRITFEGQSVTLDELKARLNTIAQGNPNQPVVIMKQADVTDGSVDALVTVCQGVSAQLKITVQTAPAFLPMNAPADNLRMLNGESATASR
jgi:biopolymer transport protein ExbD